MGKALYRTYRSKSLSDIRGQDHVTELLSRSLRAGNIAHAYLLTGPRGVGKTSIARILAHEINNLPYDEVEKTHLDIIEIDAASNNGVDDMRELRERVTIAPISAPKKIYIIDEVHMLSKAAFNALLKTLEEPPAHVVFILATTDLDKIPATILSRVQRYAFRAISERDLIDQLSFIADAEKISIEKEALTLIAQRGEGSFRDAISLLDQISHLSVGKKITRDMLEKSLGLAPEKEVEKILTARKNGDIAGVIALLKSFEESGTQPILLTSQLLSFLKKNITNTPEYIHVLNSLLLVQKSSHPHIALLSALISDIVPNEKMTHIPHAVISSPIKKQTTSVQKNAPKKTLAPREEKDGVKKTIPEKKIAQRSEKNSIFNWDTFKKISREKTVALGILDACDAELHGTTLTIFAKIKFNKTRLEAEKYFLKMRESLDEMDCGDLEINITSTTIPPKDAKIAKIAAMMGGGELVDAE